jgi:D-glycero-D-manno-heptose 1,7-bisphosphate phosphatase
VTDDLTSPKERRAVFLDRDGVINRNRVDYVKNWGEFEFEDASLEGLALLARTDFYVIVASNQSAVARNLVSSAQLEEIHRLMCIMVQDAGGRIDRILYCPHRPEENCECRKPRPGMLYRARDEMCLNLSQCYFVGDSIVDLGAGSAVGCTTVLVRTGQGRSSLDNLKEHSISPTVIVDNLYDAVVWIIERERHRTN